MLCLNKNGCSIANTGMSAINLYLSVKNRPGGVSQYQKNQISTGNIFWIIQRWKKLRIKIKFRLLASAENCRHYDFITTYYLALRVRKVFTDRE